MVAASSAADRGRDVQVPTSPQLGDVSADPTQAAAILLPILVVMDALVVKTYWGIFDRRALYLLLPGAVVGIGIGYLSAEAMNEHYMRILIGDIGLRIQHQHHDIGFLD